MKRELRFSIGTKAGRRSSVWKIWVQGDEIYLLTRTIGFPVTHKFSFHKSGVCRWAQLDERGDGGDRALKKWQRPNVSEAGLGQASHLLSIMLPTNHLSSSSPAVLSKVNFIEPAPENQAIWLRIMITAESVDYVRKVYSRSGHERLIYMYPLRSNYTALMTASVNDCGPVDIVMAATSSPGAAFGELRFPDEDVSDSGRPIRLVILSDKSGEPTVWELGGYEA